MFGSLCRDVSRAAKTYSENELWIPRPVKLARRGRKVQSTSSVVAPLLSPSGQPWVRMFRHHGQPLNFIRRPALIIFRKSSLECSLPYVPGSCGNEGMLSSSDMKLPNCDSSLLIARKRRNSGAVACRLKPQRRSVIDAWCVTFDSAMQG